MEASTVQSSSSKKNRKNLTAYWGISLNREIFDHPQIKTHLTAKPHLIGLEHIHSTLLYVGKKDDNPHEIYYHPHEGKDCLLTVTQLGCSDDAMALKIDKIQFADDANETHVPSHATQQHVTLALKQGIKAVDSIKCFNHKMIQLSEPIVIKGHIKRYLY